MGIEAKVTQVIMRFNKGENSDRDGNESDYNVTDDEIFGEGNKRKRAPESSKLSFKDDYFSTRAIETPFREVNYAEWKTLNALSIQSDANFFSLPEEWSCRYVDDKSKNKH